MPYSKHAIRDSCDAADELDGLFHISMLAALGLFATCAMTAIVDAVRGGTSRSGQQLAVFLVGLGGAVGTFLLWGATIAGCLA